jgi:aryl-alcohol dehydrogenase-like predicted oxidoreductase
MEKRTLGKSGIKVSALGLGCWAIGGPWTWQQPGEEGWAAGWGFVDDAESARAIQAGLDLGVNFFDTAANYGAGHSETVLGKALAGKRKDVVIATKFGHIINEETKTVFGDDSQILGNVEKDVENSLRRLNTDHIDVYQLHAGDMPLEYVPELMEILEGLVAAGKIRWYGWSTDHVNRADAMKGGQHFTSVQFALNIAHDDAKMRSLLVENQLAGVNKDPFSRGILTGKYAADATFPENDIRHDADLTKGEYGRRLKLLHAVKDVMTANGHTLPQACLAWIWALDDNMVPIPGFKSVKQVNENAGALALGPLSADQMSEITRISQELKKAA